MRTLMNVIGVFGVLFFGLVLFVYVIGSYRPERYGGDDVILRETSPDGSMEYTVTQYIHEEYETHRPVKNYYVSVRTLDRLWNTEQSVFNVYNIRNQVCSKSLDIKWVGPSQLHIAHDQSYSQVKSEIEMKEVKLQGRQLTIVSSEVVLTEKCQIEDKNFLVNKHAVLLPSESDENSID